MEAVTRSQPHDDQAERAVLGSILIDNQGMNVASEKLRVSDFYNLYHGQIFSAMLSLSGRNTPIEHLTLLDEMKKLGLEDEAAGLTYIMELEKAVGVTSNIGIYCDIVLEKAVLRKLISAGDEIMARSYAQKEEVAQILEYAESTVFDITQAKHKDGLTRLSETLQDTLSVMEDMSLSEGNITGVPTGFADLDRKLSGMQNSDLILLAARPSMGKTALGLNIALNAAKKKYRVVIFSLEMSKLQLSQRLLSSVSLVDLQKIIAGDISDWKLIGDALSYLSGLDIYIDDTAGISLTELRAKCRRMMAEKGIDLIVIDYLQLMTAESRTENRQQEISSISRGLKALAKEMNCPVLALAQLSRQPELRADKRPILSDLRESGAIEQDADIVMFLYRDDYYNPESTRPNTADLIVAKHRNGPTGTIGMSFLKETVKFGDLADEKDQERYGIY